MAKAFTWCRYVDLSMLPKSDSGALDLKPFDLTDNDPLSALPLVKLVDNFKASFDYVANVGTTFTFLTNKDAPLYRSVTLWRFEQLTMKL